MELKTLSYFNSQSSKMWERFKSIEKIKNIAIFLFYFIIADFMSNEACRKVIKWIINKRYIFKTSLIFFLISRLVFSFYIQMNSKLTLIGNVYCLIFFMYIICMLSTLNLILLYFTCCWFLFVCSI